jgi:hypothetical protein
MVSLIVIAFIEFTGRTTHAMSHVTIVIKDN